MNIREEHKSKTLKTPRSNLSEKRNLNESNISNNYQDNKQFNVQLIILEQVKKLKINLEITEQNKTKILYFTTISLDELISLNKFFIKFNDYSEAFDYLLKNFTKIDRTKVTYLNDNKEIKIRLLFAINDISKINSNDIIEESIEVILQNYNINSNKTLANLTFVINNLKASLEKFNLTIKELKSNINNDKIEKDKKIKSQKLRELSSKIKLKEIIQN